MAKNEYCACFLVIQIGLSFSQYKKKRDSSVLGSPERAARTPTRMWVAASYGLSSSDGTSFSNIYSPLLVYLLFDCEKVRVKNMNLVSEILQRS